MLKQFLTHLIFACALMVTYGSAYADMNEPLENRLTPPLVKQLFPESSRRNQVAGDPPIAAVLKDNTVIGYFFHFVF